jgi:hypothetical protein
MSDANHRALLKLGALRPAWTAVAPAAAALGLEGRVLLHAGPTLADPTRPPPPMLNGAVLSILHEGWATDPDAAERLILDGKVRLEPSWTRGVAVPLAAMVSPKTTVAVIADGRQRYCGYLGTGIGPQQRFGARDLAVLERLVLRENVLAAGFAQLLHEPVDLLAIARLALREGDDLHNRLSSATTVLHAALTTRKVESPAVDAALKVVQDTPTYFLNMWMPACQLMMLAAEGEPGATMVTRLCANGIETAIQIAGLPGRWFATPSAPVRGPFMKGAPADAEHPPATGDSGVIDAFGLGGQGLRHSPSLQAALGQWLPPDDDRRARRVLIGTHPVLDTLVGLDAAAVAAYGEPIILSTGMTDPHGRGLLGRGACAMPAEPFARAVEALRA